MDFASLNQSLTKRGLESVLKAQKRVWKSTELAASKGGGLGVFIDPTQKLAVRKLAAREASELPRITGTSDSQNSRLLSELSTN